MIQLADEIAARPKPVDAEGKEVKLTDDELTAKAVKDAEEVGDGDCSYCYGLEDMIIDSNNEYVLKRDKLDSISRRHLA